MRSALSSPVLPIDGRRERLERVRRIAWLLDNSIPLPGGFRIGLDAVVGLLPGVGDAIGALFSAYIINEARAMGASRSVLLRMTLNVLLETVIGSVPFAGDLFDAAYKANMRNLALLEREQMNPIANRRASRLLLFGLAVLLVLLVAALIAIPVLMVLGIVHLAS
jgi:hypothetical protein